MKQRISNRLYRVFWVLVVVFGMSLSCVTEAAESQDKCGANQVKIKALRAARKKLAHRKRRIIVNIIASTHATLSSRLLKLHGRRADDVNPQFNEYLTNCRGKDRITGRPARRPPAEPSPDGHIFLNNLDIV